MIITVHDPNGNAVSGVPVHVISNGVEIYVGLTAPDGTMDVGNNGNVIVNPINDPGHDSNYEQKQIVIIGDTVIILGPG